MCTKKRMLSSWTFTLDKDQNKILVFLLRFFQHWPLTPRVHKSKPRGQKSQASPLDLDRVLSRISPVQGLFPMLRKRNRINYKQKLLFNNTRRRWSSRNFESDCSSRNLDRRNRYEAMKKAWFPLPFFLSVNKYSSSPGLLMENLFNLWWRILNFFKISPNITIICPSKIERKEARKTRAILLASEKKQKFWTNCVQKSLSFLGWTENEWLSVRIPFWVEKFSKNCCSISRGHGRCGSSSGNLPALSETHRVCVLTCWLIFFEEKKTKNKEHERKTKSFLLDNWMMICIHPSRWSKTMITVEKTQRKN